MIPRIVHRIWLGGEEPDWTRPFAATWRLPGWELRQWGEQEVKALFPLRNQSLFDRAEEIAPDHVGQLRSDVLRYELLYRSGGVYVDADMECLRSIDELLDGVECFAAWEIQARWINNAVMGATPGHAFIARLIHGLAANVRRQRGHKPNQLSGPGYITRVWRHYRPGVTIFDRDLFYPYGYREIAAHGPGEAWDTAYAAHHWANRRREKGVPCIS